MLFLKKKITLPCYLAGRPCMIETDVVESDIPLLMSKKITLPCYLAGRPCMIETDVVESDIPLLMSKSAMKKA